MVSRDHPGHHATEVVTDEVETLAPERVGDAQHIVGERGRFVRVDLRRSRTRRVSALVERNRVVPGRPECIDLARPAP